MNYALMMVSLSLIFMNYALMFILYRPVTFYHYITGINGFTKARVSGFPLFKTDVCHWIHKCRGYDS